MLKTLLAFFTAQRLAALLVTIVGSVVGAYAAQGMSPLQWVGAATAVAASIAIAVIVHRWPAKARVRVR